MHQHPLTSILFALTLSLGQSMAQAQSPAAFQTYPLKIVLPKEGHSENLKRYKKIFEKDVKGETEDADLKLIQRVFQKRQAAEGGNVSGGGDDLIAVSSLPLDATKESVEALEAYQLQLMGLTELHEQGFAGRGVRVAVVDSGILPNSRAARNVIQFHDMTGECNVMCDFASFHGTVVSDLLIQAAPKVEIISLKIMRPDRQRELKAVISALKWIKKNHKNFNIRIVNLSLVTPAQYYGSRFEIDDARDLVSQLHAEGVFVVAASGNDYRDRVTDFPANMKDSVAVGSFSHFFSENRADFAPSSFSNYGFVPAPRIVIQNGVATQDFLFSVPKPDLLAPGARVYACAEGCYLASGTSYAAALTSGGLASLLQALPNLQRDDFIQGIRELRLLPSKKISLSEAVLAYSVNFSQLFERISESQKNPSKN